MGGHDSITVLVVDHSSDRPVPAGIENYLDKSFLPLLVEAPSPPASSDFQDVIRSRAGSEDAYARFFDGFVDKWEGRMGYIHLIAQQARASKDVILVETVGVGQDEVKIIHTAHTCIVVLVPGMGDDIQVIKAGILEIADLFVINKCDQEGADKLERHLQTAIAMGRGREDGWIPPILRTEAIFGRGISELTEKIEACRRAMKESGGGAKKLRERTRAALLDILETEVMTHLERKITAGGRWEAVLDDLVTRRKDPYSVAEAYLTEELTSYEPGPPRES